MPHLQRQIYETRKSSFHATNKVIKISFQSILHCPSVPVDPGDYLVVLHFPGASHQTQDSQHSRGSIRYLGYLLRRKINCFPGERAWLSHKLNGVWHSNVHTGANTNFPDMNRICNSGKGWGQSAKLGTHSAICSKLGTALQAYTLSPCTKFPPNPTSRKVNT